MTKKLLTTMCCTIFFLIGVSSVSGQKKEISLQEQKITIQMEKQPLGEVFKYLMENYDIPIGFEESILDREHSEYSFQTNLPSVGREKRRSLDGKIDFDIEVEQDFTAEKNPITLDIKNGKLSDVLDQIVNQMANYKWEIHDGVVNIFPIRGRDKRFEELLETKIEIFNLAAGKTVNDITFRILIMKEFKGWLSRNKLRFNPARTGSSILIDAQYGRTVETEMKFSGLSFRDLLNKITKTKKGGWILKWQSVFANGEEYIYLDI